jgi:hypothetical protein
MIAVSYQQTPIGLQREERSFIACFEKETGMALLLYFDLPDRCVWFHDVRTGPASLRQA